MILLTVLTKVATKPISNILYYWAFSQTLKCECTRQTQISNEEISTNRIKKREEKNPTDIIHFHVLKPQRLDPITIFLFYE